MDSFLKPEIVDQYRKDGAILLQGVFDQGWVEQVKLGIEHNIMNPSQYAEFLVGTGGPGAYFDDYFNWRNIPEFTEYVFKSPVAKIAGTFMESRGASFYHEHVLVKQPSTSKETPWHHDQPYYPIDGDKVCSIWMPVDSVCKENSLKFVAGSHLWNRWFIPRKFATATNYENENEEVEENKRLYESVPDIDQENHTILQWAVEPGDCIVFHMRTLHSAPGNVSETKSRRVLSTRWLGDDAIMASRPWTPSPPHMGGLKPGDKADCPLFPLVWSKNKCQN